ncbi:MBOAT family O-acyltransferase [Candidatus Symbiobacter mobilis]|uniref:Probable alginate O-acetylase AlgI n=1 Tax=Candidatus Symbiobacter mobilis CR TaxID=946483 RepID=U5ND68_9BURK|nr:MBOAT family protein [Candidatus Symbiobacter mobilis]AGX88119.1 D-alanine exporter-like protein [Candidatus Symbiobacter mobilis CR]
MVFSSLLFLFVFLPLFLGVYYLVPQRGRSLWILLGSLFFYAWWRLDFLALLVGVTCGSYALALAMDASEAAWRKRWLAVGVGLNLAALGYFKYANFGVDSLNALLAGLGMSTLSWTPILLPIGLSFYIFHAISYLVDIYRREAPPARDLIDFSAFIALFPHLVAGPVLRYHLLAEQFRHREHSLRKFSQGCHLFLLGFCKKVLIADSVAPVADAAFALASPGLWDAWLGTVAYTIQLFFDFSGYSDMAIGLALMMGFTFPQNFHDPYTSTSITEFWKRWHMSLSQWLREYLYIPLGGNRKGTVRTYFNLFLTMVLGGLWHGANWTFVLWGAWHGAILAAERYRGTYHGPSTLPRAVQVAWTMLLVMLGWVLFRAADIHGAWRMVMGMFGGNGVGWGLHEPVGIDQALVMGIAIVWVYAAPWVRRHAPPQARLLVLPAFVWAVGTLCAGTFTPFLYFQF